VFIYGANEQYYVATDFEETAYEGTIILSSE
jgi:hypothetical protein